MLKPKQFIDIVKNLTIYYEKKTKDGNLKNIFLNDKLGENEFQITFAKTGKFQVNNKKKVLI